MDYFIVYIFLQQNMYICEIIFYHSKRKI